MEENYNIFEAVYPSIEADNKRQSRGYETLVRNNMDTAEFMGEEPDSDAGVVDRAIKGNEINSFIKDTVDFIASIPADTLIGITRAGANATQKGIQLGRFIADEAGIDYAVDDLTAINDKINKFKEGLNQYQEDSPFITRLMGYAAQEGSAVYPLYRKFKQMGMPRSYAMMLSFGIGGTLSLGPEDQLTLDSKAAKYFKDVFKVEEGGPGEDVFNMGWAALENTVIGRAFDEVIEGLRYGKKIIKGSKVDQGSIAVGGGTASGAAVEEATEQPEQPQQPMLNDEQGNFLDEKEKFGQVQTDYPPDNQIAGGTGVAKQIFKSMLKEGAEKLPNKGSGAQFLGQLQNQPGIKEAEIKWTGLDDYLKKNKTITKKDVQDYLSENQITIKETKLGGDAKNVRQFGDEDRYDLMEEFTDILETESMASDAVDELEFLNDYIIANGGERFDTFSGRVIKTVGGVTDTLDYDTLNIGRMKQNFGFVSGYMENLPRYNNPREFYLAYKDGAYRLTNIQDDAFLEEFIDDYRTAVRKHRKELPSFLEEDDVYLTKEEYNLVKNELVSKGFDNVDFEKLVLNETNSNRFYNEAMLREGAIDFETNFGGINALKFLGDREATKFGRYTLPGGEDYTEIILKAGKNNRIFSSFTFPVQKNNPLPEKMGLTKATSNEGEYVNNMSPHFGEDGEIAHVRFKTRYKDSDLDSEKILAVDEMQSDILQTVKSFNAKIKDRNLNRARTELETERGLSNIAGEEVVEKAKTMGGEITDFPFKNNWYDLVIKRLIRYGADNDFDAIAVPRGKVAQNRYGQKGDFVNKLQIEKVNYTNFGPDFDVNLLSKDGEILNTLTMVTPERLKNILNDYKVKASDLDNIDDFVSTTKENPGVTKLDFEVGDKKKFVGKGKGKLELYDQAIPSMMKKYAKKFKTKVTTETIDGNEYVVFSLTDDLKKTAKEDGQALFNYFGIGTAGAAVSQGVLDSQGNNTISQSTNN